MDAEQSDQPISSEKPQNVDSLAASVLQKPAPLVVPEIAKPLMDVFKVGGLPLAFLFVAALLLSWLITQQIAAGALSTFLLIVAITLGASFASFVFLVTLGYIKWRQDLKSNIERYRLDMETYKELYRSEITLQENFMLAISNQAAQIASSHSEWSPSDYEKGVTAFGKAVDTMLPKMMDIRAKMRLSSHPSLPTPSITVTADSTSKPGQHQDQNIVLGEATESNAAC
jgi:hypothetical protein